MEKSSLESTQEFFNLCLKTYEATFGRLVEMPAVGPTREKSEKMMKGFSTFFELYTTWMDSNVNFQGVFMEAMRRMHEKMGSEMEGEISPEKYKDFYKLWIETYGETFKEFLKSGHFAEDMGKLMSHFMEFQKYNREMLEENYLKPMNLPTKSEIDEINKELYSLKKMVKESNLKTRDLLKRTEIDEIKKELDSLKGTVEETNLKTMDLPTKTEIGEINKELDALRERIKESNLKTMDLPAKTEIDEINKELDSLKATVKKLTGQIKEPSLTNPSKKKEHLGVHQIKKK